MISKSGKSLFFCCLVLVNVLASSNVLAKPPINADFVNGLWARIGKRNPLEIKCNDPQLDLNTFLLNCVEYTKDDTAAEKPLGWSVKDVSEDKPIRKLKGLLSGLIERKMNENILADEAAAAAFESRLNRIMK